MARGKRFVTRHDFTPWRHGGWYVGDARYPSGAVGCVSNNYEDRKWRIACGRPHDERFPTREAAADAEVAIAAAAGEAAVAGALAAGATFVEGPGRQGGVAHRARRGVTESQWLGDRAMAAHAFLEALRDEPTILAAMAAGAAFAEGPEGFRAARGETATRWHADKRWAAREFLELVGVEDAVAAGAEFVEGCGQFRAGRGAVVTPWLATRGRAALAFLEMTREAGATPS